MLQLQQFKAGMSPEMVALEPCLPSESAQAAPVAGQRWWSVA